MRVHEAIEYEIEGGYTVIIEWSDRWRGWVGTITDRKGRSGGTILRDNQADVLTAAQQTVKRKG